MAGRKIYQRSKKKIKHETLLKRFIDKKEKELKKLKNGNI